MKKTLLKLFALILSVCALLCVGVACDNGSNGGSGNGGNGGNNPPTHTHVYKDSIIAPTCTEKGYTKHTCECGDTYNDTEVNALGHDYGEYVYDNNATYESDGTKTATCKRDGCSAKDTVAVTGTMLESYIEFKTLEVDGTNVNHVVRNSQTEFDFNQEITVVGNVRYVVTLDKNGAQQSLTKVVDLSAGDNTFYVVQTNDGEIEKTYTVKIRRKPMYNVNFNTHGGTWIEAQSIEEGFTATEPTAIPERTGYNFTGWDFDFETPILDTTVIDATWNYYTVTTDTDNAEAGTYTQYNQTKISIGETVTLTATPNAGYNFIGWYNGTERVSEELTYSFTMAEENVSFTAKWEIIVYNISYDLNGGEEIEDLPETYTVEDYPDLSNISEKLAKDGFNFYNWQDENANFIASLSGKTGNITLRATWDSTIFTTNGSFVTGLTDYGKTLTSLAIPEENRGIKLTSIGDLAFYDCESLETIEIPSSVTSIGRYAFSYCYSLTSIEIPSSVTSIDEYAFLGCESLTIYCEASSKPSGWDSYWNGSCPVVWDYKNNDVAEDGYIYTVIDGIRYGIKDGVATVVRQPKNLTTANIPASISYKNNTYSVTSIGAYAFFDCRSLTSIKIPSSVTSIGNSVFSFCDSLTIYCEASSKPSGWDSYWNESYPVVWDYKNNDVASDGYIYTVIDGIRYGIKYGVATVVEQPKNIKTANILESISYKNNTYSVTSIGSYAFSGCISLKTIEITSSVTSIGDRAFYNCYSLTSIKVDSNNAIYKSIDGNLYSKDGTKLIQYAIGKTDTLFAIPSSVTSIGNEAFYKCESLTSIEIPSSVTSIGAYAFYKCESLTSVTFGNNSQLTSIGDYAFSGCDSLTSIEIPSSVTSIGSYAFSYCDSLTSIKYNGTIAQWNAVTKGSSWNYEVPAMHVECTDGKVWIWY